MKNGSSILKDLLPYIICKDAVPARALVEFVDIARFQKVRRQCLKRRRRVEKDRPGEIAGRGRCGICCKMADHPVQFFPLWKDIVKINFKPAT